MSKLRLSWLRWYAGRYAPAYRIWITRDDGRSCDYLVLFPPDLRRRNVNFWRKDRQHMAKIGTWTW